VKVVLIREEEKILLRIEKIPGEVDEEKENIYIIDKINKE
jgi:hypothetical protein